MSQKQKTIALITVALLVWGYAAMEWFNYLGNDTEVGASTHATQTNYPTDFFQIAEIYEPVYDYSDPFLKSNVTTYSAPATQNIQTIHNPSNNTPSSNFKDKPSKIEVKEELPLEYKGLITSTKQKYALLLIGTSSHIVREGDIVNGILIQSFNDKSISIKRGTSPEVLIKK